MIRTITVLAACSLLSSCFCSKPRKFANEPQPRYITQVVTYTDTQVVTEVRSFDTIISLQTRDTIIIRDKETNVEVRVVKLPGDSIFVEPICPPDTVKIEKVKIETIEERLVKTVGGGGKWWKGVAVAGMVIVGIFASAYLVKVVKA